MTNFCIKGDKKQNKKILDLLIKMGGRNIYELSCGLPNYLYYIDEDTKAIRMVSMNREYSKTIFNNSVELNIKDDWELDILTNSTFKDKNDDFIKLSEESVKVLLNTNKEFLDVFGNDKTTIEQRNKLLKSYSNYLKFSDNQYKIRKGKFSSKFNSSLHFEDSKSAKLYDALFEFFLDNGRNSEIDTIIGMIQSYTKKDK